MTDTRVFTRISTCQWCSRRPEWVVSDFGDQDGALFDPQEEWVLVCDTHKTTAFS